MKNWEIGKALQVKGTVQKRDPAHNQVNAFFMHSMSQEKDWASAYWYQFADQEPAIHELSRAFTRYSM